MLYLYVYVVNPRFYKNMLPPVEFYLPKFQIDHYTLNDIFEVVIYQYPVNDYFMIIIKPQKYHFFIEDGKLIYHPRYSDNVSKYYNCPTFFEKAYQLPVQDVEKEGGGGGGEQQQQRKNIVPKIICHRNLKYLKSNIYTKQIHKKSFDDFCKTTDALVYSLDVIKMYLKRDEYHREYFSRR